MAPCYNPKKNRDCFIGEKRSNCFQNFFKDPAYVLAKRYIYNYHIRKKAVKNCLGRHERQHVLEIGCGVAPVAENLRGVVYTDLSYTAVKYLRQDAGPAHCVVADGANLPFKANVFSHVISSEVLEHIEDDDAVLKEVSRVMCSGGKSIITFPHRKFYFSVDDRYVEHFRRYEIEEMKAKLLECGFKTLEVEKVLGPLEKITMWTVTGALSLYNTFGVKGREKKNCVKAGNALLLEMVVFVFKWVNRYYGALARLDAKIMPMKLSTVLVIKSQLSDGKTP